MNLTVSKAGNGDFKTINEALVAAVPGARIQIKAGVYEEPLIITKPVSLIGDKESLVVIHHPDFTAMKIENTQVILQDLAIGTSLSRGCMDAAGSSIEMRNCAVAPTDVLSNQPEMSLNAFIAKGKECAASDPLSKNDLVKDVTFDPHNAFGVLVLTGKSSVSFSNGFLHSASVNTVDDSEFIANGCGFYSSPLSIRGNRGAVLDHCAFCCDPRSHFPLSWLVRVQDSSATIRSSSFFGGTKEGILCEGSAVTIDDCTILGFWKPHSENKSTGVAAVGELNLAITNSKIGRFTMGINPYASVSGDLKVMACTISDNSEGFDGSSYESQKRFLVTFHKCTISNNGCGCHFWGKGRHSHFAMKGCKILGNKGVGTGGGGVRVSGWKGDIYECEFSDNTPRHLCGVGPIFRRKHVRDCSFSAEKSFWQRVKEDFNRSMEESKGGSLIQENLFPKEFTKLEQDIFTMVKSPGDTYDEIRKRFLESVNAIDPNNAEIPRCIKNAVAKKMMYEYHRKYGTLIYGYQARDTLSCADVLRRLAAEERASFLEFSKAHTL